jgi:microcin C transport system permease protein
MKTYFLRRILLLIPTFIGITVLVFAITRFVPGGPIEQMLARAQQSGGEGGGSSTRGGSQNLTEEQMEDLKKFYGFDKPILVSYGEWLGKVVTLDLGTSTRYQEPVWDLIKTRIPVSMIYGIITLLITYSISIPLGILKAVKHKSRIDTVSSIFIFVCYAVPAHVLGIVLLVVFAANTDLFPMSGIFSENFSDLSTWEQVKDVVWHGLLPLATYVAGSFALLTMMMKNALLENLAADYVRTAMAKGLEFKKAVLRHALRNSLIPLATYVGSSIGIIISGSFLVEFIFNIDGMGLLGYEALVQRDYPIVMGILVLDALAILCGNIMSDFFIALVDPRVQFE